MVNECWSYLLTLLLYLLVKKSHKDKHNQEALLVKAEEDNKTTETSTTNFKYSKSLIEYSKAITWASRIIISIPIIVLSGIRNFTISCLSYEINHLSYIKKITYAEGNKKASLSYTIINSVALNLHDYLL